MIDANTPDSYDSTTAEGDRELWGFIPDEVLPTLKTIAVDKKFAYTTDGRMIAEDIYVHGATTNPWKTILLFGLKDGGRSFYALNITKVETGPRFYWNSRMPPIAAPAGASRSSEKDLYSDGSIHL